MNIGTILIYISLAVSIVSLFFLAKSARGDANSLMSAERLFYLSGITIVFTSILLLVAFLTGSFNFSYVYSYSSKDMHFIYKIAAFWAGQEGTFLLWILLLFIFGALVIRKKDEDENIVLSIVIITQIFILIVLCIHSPFKYVWQAFPNRFRPGIAPPDGSGLNPLLLDPWMIVHPPILFLGYASATIPFAYAIAALLKKDYKSWVQRSYNWLLFCMTSLGIGIFLGAYWAYKVLGWGGYWGWDPVENSSLIPWLIIVALMHGLYIQKRKNILVKSNLFMAIISFVLIFYGTFLTRSGVLSDFSVHSFADLGLSGYLIFFIIFFLFIGVFLFIKRFKEIETSQLSNKILTLENLLTYGILTLCVYSLFILTGTSMPILSKIFLSNPTSVSIKFYNTISIPLGIFILSFLILATFYQFKKDINKKNIILITSISVISGILLNVFHTKSISAYIFITLGLFIIIQNIINLIKYKTENIISSRLAHIGVGFLVIGFITSNIHSFAVQKILPMGVEKDIES
ncbi:MAG: cytochrome c biogenesis protein CcsA, partial [Spirochaetota bacterium]|nr:cytochrome c biogenesis protein CcsA [Spirochaetota bacterium]